MSQQPSLHIHSIFLLLLKLGFYLLMILSISSCRIFNPPPIAEPVTIEPDESVCQYLNVDFPEGESGSCCRKLAIISSYPEGIYNVLSVPTTFAISTSNDQPIAISTSGDISAASVGTTAISWSNFSSGRVELGEVCFDQNHGGIVEFSWYNNFGQKICSESINVFCGESNPAINPPTNCCKLDVFLVNKNKDNLSLKKVQVTALNNTEIVNSDPDFWQETILTNETIEWQPTVGPIPFGLSINNDFALYVAQSAESQTFRIDWFDMDNELVGQHEVEINCQTDYSEETDWTMFTTATIPNDDMFVFFVKNEFSPDCGLDDTDFKTDSECSVQFDDSVHCVGNYPYLYLHGPDNFDEYEWEVTRDEGNDISTTITSVGGKNPAPIPLNENGEYTIELVASTSTDMCLGSSVQSIHSFDPDFIRERKDCNLTYEFQAIGFEDDHIDKVIWECSDCENFPEEGEFVSFQFPELGVYQIKLTLVDTYGCEHSLEKPVTISSDCEPKFVYSYDFCTNDCVPSPGSSTANIEVVFKNLSDGGICPITYTWEFEDDENATIVTSEKNDVSKVYAFDPSDPMVCETGGSYSVTLTMEDASGCIQTYTQSVQVKTCQPEIIDIESCSSGKIMLRANMPGKWTAPSGTISTDIDADSDAYFDTYTNSYLSDCIVVGYSENGIYDITFEGLCVDTKGRCEITESIEVNIDCCAKNDKIKDAAEFILNDNRYKVKYWYKQRQLPLYHRIKAKTKIKIQKTLLIQGWTYYAGYKADTVHASFSGTIFRQENSTTVSCSGLGKCNCKMAEEVEGSDTRDDSKKAKISLATDGKFRSKVNSIESYHYVVIEGEKKGEHTLQLGSSELDCDPFKWWNSWY